MKRVLLLLMCAIMIFCTTGCAAEENTSSANSPQKSTFVSFDTIDEFKEYMHNEKSETAAFARNSESIYIPSESLMENEFKAELDEVVIDNIHYYFKYTVKDVDLSEIATGHNIVDTLTNEDEITAYAAGNEEPIDPETLRICAEDFTIGWARGADGEEILNALAGSNPLDYWESHPGYYYTKSPYLEMEDPIGYMIYWVHDGTFFQASVPAQKLDAFWESIDSMIEEMPY